MKPKADILFEASWEVCNKVGGIFTVLSSKSKQIQKYYKNQYFLIGPYFEEASRTSFKETVVPEKYQKINEELKSIGIVCHFGHWLVEGDPSVILIDFKGYESHLNDIKKELWDLYQVDSLGSARDFDEPLLWSYAVGILMEKIKSIYVNKKVILQAHEWLSGGSILYIKKNNLNIPTIFTTHATVLGRTLAGNGSELYSILNKVNPDLEAKGHGVIAKHSLEKASARASSVFTTVSQTTASEAEKFLGRKVDIILPNGLDMSEFPSFEEITHKHNRYRNKLREFCLYYFSPYYQLDLQDSLFFFTASRYEFHNKGVDVLIESLGLLNEYMKKAKHKKTIVSFFFIPTSVQEIRPEIINAREAFNDIKDLLDEEKKNIEDNILYAVTAEKPLDEKVVFGDDFMKKMERKIMRLKAFTDKNAPLSTHILFDEKNDAILKAFKVAGLENKKEDKVKVIFYPIYLSGADGLGDLDYYESIQASHLGIFPSYYEPWGYTPLEAAAWGVSAITSNLSGFGKYFYNTLNGVKMSGVKILDMENRGKEQVVRELTKNLIRYTNYDRKERIENKIKARKIASMADWKIFAKYYIEAHDLSLDKK
jgi:glycogen(starch) synthase